MKRLMFFLAIMLCPLMASAQALTPSGKIGLLASGTFPPSSILDPNTEFNGTSMPDGWYFRAGSDSSKIGTYTVSGGFLNLVGGHGADYGNVHSWSGLCFPLTSAQSASFTAETRVIATPAANLQMSGLMTSVFPEYPYGSVKITCAYFGRRLLIGETKRNFNSMEQWQGISVTGPVYRFRVNVQNGVATSYYSLNDGSTWSKVPNPDLNFITQGPLASGGMVQICLISYIGEGGSDCVNAAFDYLHYWQ